MSSNFNPVEKTPKTIKLDYDLVRCETLKDFIDPVKGTKILMMPYWILMDDGVLWFEFVKASTKKAEILPLIRKGRIYIRACNLSGV